MEFKEFAEHLGSLAVLDEPVRRKLYDFVAGRAEEVSRDEAAKGTGVPRALAAFHLDKLVKAGLLEVTFRRLSDRTGPGAGRPSKLYRRAAKRFEVSLPQRRYELAAQVLVQALAGVKSKANRELLRESAREWGARLAEQAAVRKPRGLPLSRATHALKVCGFEPQRTPEGEVVLRNCPFESLRDTHGELICGMNVALVEGLLSGLELEGVTARFAPQAGCCCVAIREE